MNTLNAFFWREQRAIEQPKTMSPQLAYFHRKIALGTHPRQLRKQGVQVLSQSEAVALSNKVRAAKQKTAISAN